MLRRKIGDKVFINPYEGVIGTIIDSKDNAQPFHPSWDYIVKFNCPVDMGGGVIEQEYFNDDELDILEKNWRIIKSI